MGGDLQLAGDQAQVFRRQVDAVLHGVIGQVALGNDEQVLGRGGQDDRRHHGNPHVPRLALIDHIGVRLHPRQGLAVQRHHEDEEIELPGKAVEQRGLRVAKVAVGAEKVEQAGLLIQGAQRGVARLILLAQGHELEGAADREAVVLIQQRILAQHVLPDRGEGAGLVHHHLLRVHVGGNVRFGWLVDGDFAQLGQFFAQPLHRKDRRAGGRRGRRRGGRRGRRRGGGRRGRGRGQPFFLRRVAVPEPSLFLAIEECLARQRVVGHQLRLGHERGGREYRHQQQAQSGRAAAGQAPPGAGGGPPARPGRRPRG